VFHILLSTLFLVMLLYFFLHLQHCTTIQVLTKDEVLKTDFGDNQLKNVPDNLVIPVKYNSLQGISICFTNVYHRGSVGPAYGLDMHLYQTILYL
jgi:hypothetical protein